jgi:hypothetical protein
MIRKIALLCVLSASALFASLPYEIQDKIVHLNLRDPKISYKEGGIYIGVIGINTFGKKAAYVSMRHILSDFSYRWTPFASIPYDQKNTVFAIIQQGDKLVVVQSREDYTNSMGHVVEVDHETQRLIVTPIKLPRIHPESEADTLVFSSIMIE